MRKRMKPLDIINPLRKTDPYIQNIFSMGGCYQFFLFLKAIFPNAEPYMSSHESHVLTKIHDRFYDIDGEASKYDISSCMPFTDEHYKIAEEWSFSHNHLLSAGECKHCGEPILLEAFIQEESVI